MGSNDGLGDLVRQQIEEIMGKYDKLVIGDIPLSAVVSIFLNSGVIKYEIREDVPQEEVDGLVRKLTEIGFPNDIAQELGTKAYELVPTREMKSMMDRAVELAGHYLPELADVVTNGKLYLNTQHGRRIELSAGSPQINGDAVEVPVNLRNYWVMQREEGKRKASFSETNSGSQIVVENPLGDYKIKGPTKQEFRQSALEAALDYLASPPNDLFRGKA